MNTFKITTHRLAQCLFLALLALAPVNYCRAEYNLLIADHTNKKLIIRSKGGEIIWQQAGTALYEAWMLSDGSIVYSTKTTVEKIVPDLKAGEGGKTIWSYQYGTGIENPPKGTIHTCTPHENGHILVTESGTTRLVELNKIGEIEHSIPLPSASSETHVSLRLTRRTADGTFLVPYMGDGILYEISRQGKAINQQPIGSVYEAIPLSGNRLLVSCGPENKALILNDAGKTEWELTGDDLPGIDFSWVTKVIPLKNGNIIVCNYCKGKAKVKAFEVTPEKKVVWKLEDERIGGLTMLQILNDDFRPLEHGIGSRR